MRTLTHDVFGKDVKTEADALAAFWLYMSEHNGNRLTKPQDFITVEKVWYQNGEGWKVKYRADESKVQLKADSGKSPPAVQVLGWVETARIAVTGMNPRKQFSEEGMKGLVESIRQDGILEPLVVRRQGDDFELVLGERRLRAAKELCLEKVPVVVRELTDQQALEAMLTENIQREDLNPVEEAEAIRRYIEASNLTQKEAAERLGKSETWVTRRLQLLDLPQDLKDLLTRGDLTPKHIEKLAPFVPYPIYRAIIRQLKDRLQVRGDISVNSLQQLIDGTVKTDYHADWALNLNTFPYEHRHLRPFFDFKECAGCAGKKVVYETEIESDREFCIDRRCYANKLNLAKEAYEKHLAGERKDPAPAVESEAPRPQKCHVLECTKQAVEGSHYCEDHQTPESRRKADEEPVVEQEVPFSDEAAEEEGGVLRCSICRSLRFSKQNEDVMLRYILSHIVSAGDAAHDCAMMKIARLVKDELMALFEEADD